MSAIIKSLDAGKEVTTHESPISVPGYTGSGYRIFDPVTGSSADMISGGLSGGFLEFLSDAISILISMILGSVDGYYGKYLKEKDPIFTKDKVLVAQAARALGLAFLIYSAIDAYRNSDLSIEQKIQQISIILTSYVITNYLVGRVAIYGAGILSGILGAILAGVIAIITVTIIYNYTLIFLKKEQYYA